jgi:hypothetical protein
LLANDLRHGVLRFHLRDVDRTVLGLRLVIIDVAIDPLA